MTAEKLKEIDAIIAQEIDEYEQLSSLFDEKKQVLIKSKTDELEKVDLKIREKVRVLNNFEKQRKYITQEIGLGVGNLTEYINFANQNCPSLTKNLTDKKNQLNELNNILRKKESINKELLVQGMGTINRLIKIIVNGATKTTQYNSYGQNTINSELKISSFEEEV